VVAVHPSFEVRRYDAHVVAEVTVQTSHENAGNRAFRSLAAYIGGRNHTARTIAMTASVVQEAGTGRRLAMTAPVVHRKADGQDSYVVGLVMPADETLETLPEPDDSAVALRAVPVEFAAALRYSGRWTRTRYEERAKQLKQAVAEAGLRAVGQPRWARFDPPWTPWFLRRNEVVLPIATP
jgi:hypothetical protein